MTRRKRGRPTPDTAALFETGEPPGAYGCRPADWEVIEAFTSAQGEPSEDEKKAYLAACRAVGKRLAERERERAGRLTELPGGAVRYTVPAPERPEPQNADQEGVPLRSPRGAGLIMGALLGRNPWPELVVDPTGPDPRAAPVRQPPGSVRPPTIEEVRKEIETAVVTEFRRRLHAEPWFGGQSPAPPRTGPDPEDPDPDEDHPMFGPSEAARHGRDSRSGPDPRAADLQAEREQDGGDRQ